MPNGIEEKEGALGPLLAEGRDLVSAIEVALQVREIKDRILRGIPEEGVTGDAPIPSYECPSIEALGQFVLLFRAEEHMGDETGWVRLPADDIPAGSVGYHFFRRMAPVGVPNANEMAFSISYHLHGKLDVEEVRIRDNEHLRELMFAPDTYSADDPRRRLIGYTRYYPEESRSVWATMPLTRLREASLPPDVLEAVRTAAGRAQGKDPFSAEKERLQQLLDS